MLYNETSQIVSDVKLLLGIKDGNRDRILELLVEDTITAVLAYCRIEVLPYQLYGLIAQMTVKSYRANGYGAAETPTEIKSISEGDRSISFEQKNGANGILSDYKSRLKPFVNLKGRVPSEIKR